MLWVGGRWPEKEASLGPRQPGAPRRTALGIGHAHGVQQTDEPLELQLTEGCYGVLVGGVHERVQRVEQLPTSVGHKAEDLTPIRYASLSPDEHRVLELVEESRDRGTLFDHPFTDRKRRNPTSSRATDDPKRVVLSQAQPIWLNDSRQRAVHD